MWSFFLFSQWVKQRKTSQIPESAQAMWMQGSPPLRYCILTAGTHHPRQNTLIRAAAIGCMHCSNYGFKAELFNRGVHMDRNLVGSCCAPAHILGFCEHVQNWAARVCFHSAHIGQPIHFKGLSYTWQSSSCTFLIIDLCAFNCVYQGCIFLC